MVYKSKKRRIKNKFGGQGEAIQNSVPPTLKDNLNKFADIWLQSFNNLSMYTLDKIEDNIKNVSIKWGINPDNSFKSEIDKLGKKAEQLNDVLDTPQGQKALSDVTELFNKITKNVIVPNSQKLAEELIKNLQPIMIRGQNAIFALLSASPFGAIIDIPRFVSESLGVIEKSVTLADDVLDIGLDTVEQVKTEKSNFDNILSELGSLTEHANTQISSGLDSVKNSVDNYGKGIMDTGLKTGLTSGLKTGLTSGLKTGLNSGLKTGLTSGLNSGLKTGLNSGLNDVNKSFEQYKKEAKMIGGRVKNAYSEFTSPIITAPQIIKQYGGTRKRRIINRNRFSRRYK